MNAVAVVGIVAINEVVVGSGATAIVAIVEDKPCAFGKA